MRLPEPLAVPFEMSNGLAGLVRCEEEGPIFAGVVLGG